MSSTSAPSGTNVSVAGKQGKLWAAGTLGLALLCMALYTFFISRHRILWGDEMFGWVMVTDPDWHHMLRAWNLGADGGGITYYVLCRFWLHLAGQSELAFRAFSALGVFTAFAVMWRLLRLFYRPLPVAASLFVVFSGSRIILWQLVQCRFYGLLLGATALAFYALATRPAERDSVANLVLLFAAHLLLVSTHPLGAGYSAALLSAYVIVDVSRKRLRPVSYVAVVTSWSILLFSRTAMRASAQVGKPWFWTTRPGLSDLRAFYEPSFFVPPPKLILVLLVAYLVWPNGRRKLVSALTARRDVLIPAISLTLVPVALWILSQGATSYFVDRYMIPTTLGFTVLGSELLEEFLPMRFSWPYPVAVAGVIGLLISCGRFAVVSFPTHLHLPDLDFTGALAAQLPRNVPIAIPDNDVFELMVHYRGRADLPICYPVDWPLALDKRSPRDLVSSENEMKNWRSSGYYAANIADSDTYLKRTSHFIAVQGGGVHWVQIRLQGNPGWRVTRLPDFDSIARWHQEIWQVDRLSTPRLNDAGLEVKPPSK